MIMCVLFYIGPAVGEGRRVIRVFNVHSVANILPFMKPVIMQHIFWYAMQVGPSMGPLRKASCNTIQESPILHLSRIYISPFMRTKVVKDTDMP